MRPGVTLPRKTSHPPGRFLTQSTDQTNNALNSRSPLRIEIERTLDYRTLIFDEPRLILAHPDFDSTDCCHFKYQGLEIRLRQAGNERKAEWASTSLCLHGVVLL